MDKTNSRWQIDGHLIHLEESLIFSLFALIVFHFPIGELLISVRHMTPRAVVCIQEEIGRNHFEKMRSQSVPNTGRRRKEEPDPYTSDKVSSRWQESTGLNDIRR